MEPDLELLREALGEPVVGWAPAHERGYTRTRRWRVRTASGPRFVKEAWEEGPLAMLRREALVYGNVTGPFMPGFEDFADAGDHACLALELLDRASWPPPYPEDTTPLFTSIEQIGATTPPAGLPSRSTSSSRWEQIAADPTLFLALGLCSQDWLRSGLADLIAAEPRAVIAGDDLLHNDVYSGNVCFDSDRAILFAGGFAVGATSPLPDWAEPDATLRADQVDDLAGALQCTVEALELPPLS